MIQRKRVFVAAMSTINPLGVSVESSFERLIDGECAVVSLADDERYQDLECKVGAPLPEEYEEIEDQYETSFGKQKLYTLANAIVSNAVDAAPAFKEHLDGNKPNYNIGCIMSSRHGQNLIESDDKLRIVKTMPNILPSLIAMKLGLNGIVSSGEVSGAGGMAALGEAYRLITYGRQDAMVVGGADINLQPQLVAGYEAIGALCTREYIDEEPEEALRPFDEFRSGTVLGDGGGAMILGSEEFLKRIGAEPIAEIAGFGQTNDATHLLRPLENGESMLQAMNMALTEAGIDLAAGGDENAIDLFNCHASSTKAGDSSEGEAIRRLVENATKLQD